MKGDGPVSHSYSLRQVLELVRRAYRRHDDQATQRLLAAAIDLAPHRLDLYLDLANSHIQSGEVDDALFRCRQALSRSATDVESLTFLAHWARFAKDRRASDNALDKLAAVRSQRAEDLTHIWNAIDAIGAPPISDEVPLDLDFGPRAVLILGYVLNADGSMHDILLGRLAKGAEAVRRHPEAEVVVSGGVPRAGRVEAEVMSAWLAANGVPPEQIHEEGHARDIVENILYSRHILDWIGAEQVLIITSAVDVRRTRLIAEIAAWANGSAWRSYTMAAVIGDQRHARDSGPDDIKIYRDTLRAYGIPMMRTYPNLVEL